MAQELIQSATVLTNELRLHDWKNAKMSITFGESDQDGEYCYLNVKYKATEEKMDFILDRDTYNIAGPTIITLNDHKIWHENNDGPNSGLNADLLDGRHAIEFKDRYGYHHFVHMFKPPTIAPKHFVKIARFTTRKVGTPDEFKSDGTPPYSGIFKYTGNGVGGVSTDDVVTPGGTFTATDIISGMQIRDAITQFQADTPYALDDYDPDLFHSTNMLTQGVYNGTLRAAVTMLKDGHPTTFDIHVGLFENPLTTEKDGWNAIDKYFYVSLHDETLPFLKESDWTLATKNDSHLNDGVFDLSKVNADTDDLNGDKDANGKVVDGYNPTYPNFPSYAWSDNAMASRANNNYGFLDDVTSGHAMANLYFSKPDGTKAQAMTELRREFNNNASAALVNKMNAIKALGTAMADLDGNGIDDKVDKINNDIKAAKDDYDNDVDDMQDDLDDMENVSLAHSNPTEAHDRHQTQVDLPSNNTGKYTPPVKTEEDAEPYRSNRRREPFPDANAKDQGDSYQQFVDIMRLYHVASRTDVIDGISVDTHFFDLYVAVDAKAEVRVQPYMSSACLMYNFQPCLQEADLPQRKFIRPKSIYDNRYASVRHRHYDYERRIWELTLEADQLWKNFDNYVKLEQGYQNAQKIMQTDKNGRVYAAVDNMERHTEPVARRAAGRVMVTLKQALHSIEGEVDQFCSCLGVSEITIDELYALKGINGNIQEQLDALDKAIGDLKDAVDNIWDAINTLAADIIASMGDFVKKSGDQMTGSLWMKYNGKTYKDDPAGYEKPESFVGVKFFSDAPGAKHGGYLYGATPESHVGLGVEKVPGSGAQSDWALAVTPKIDDSDGYAIMLNHTRIQFTKNGRGGGGTPTTFNLDFEKLRDWWHNEIAPTTSYGELDG